MRENAKKMPLYVQNLILMEDVLLAFLNINCLEERAFRMGLSIYINKKKHKIDYAKYGVFPILTIQLDA